MKKNSPALVLNFILLVYVLLQFIWWAYLIYELNAEILTLSFDGSEEMLELELRKKLWMIIGEGAVFISLVLIGSFFIRKYIMREQRLAKQERNFLLATTHELNSPIAATKLNLQTLRRIGLNPDQTMLMVESGLSNVNRLEKLVSNILTASRIDGGKFQIVKETANLKDLLIRIVNRHQVELEESRIETSINVSPELEISVDERALELVFENLLANSLKYAKGAQFGINAQSSRNKTSIEVYDTGRGVPSDQRRFIFTKFYRIENEETRAQKGTGLGLYLVKEVIKMHNGSIKAMDNDPSGLKFIIELPKTV